MGSYTDKAKNQSSQKYPSRDVMLGGDLWVDGLICAFEFHQFDRKINPTATAPKSGSAQNVTIVSKQKELIDEQTGFQNFRPNHSSGHDCFQKKCWVPIGWDRVYELVQMVQADSGWDSQSIEFPDNEEDMTVADVAAPYLNRPIGPTWWCHVAAGHPCVDNWLSNAQWLHPAVSIALRDESRLISDKMRHLLYEELLTARGNGTPQSIHEVIAHLASRLARWDDRLFRKSIFGAADEVELKFMDRRSHENLHLLTIILNQEIRRLSTQVIRVKWSLHAREEIVFELLQHLRGNAGRNLLEGMRKGTREMIEEQEAVRGRLFTIQDVMQSAVRAWLQDRSLRITHNLGVIGGCGLILSIITGLFGVNVDGIPGAEDSPYAFVMFSGLLLLFGMVLIGVGMLYLGLKKPYIEKEVATRKLELQELVRMFQQEAETHAQVRKSTAQMKPWSIPSNASEYVLIG